jgi:hypothetical protein
MRLPPWRDNGPQGLRRPRFSFFRFTCQTARDRGGPTLRKPGEPSKPLLPTEIGRRVRVLKTRSVRSFAGAPSRRGGRRTVNGLYRPRPQALSTVVNAGRWEICVRTAAMVQRTCADGPSRRRPARPTSARPDAGGPPRMPDAGPGKALVMVVHNADARPSAVPTPYCGHIPPTFLAGGDCKVGPAAQDVAAPCAR